MADPTIRIRLEDAGNGGAGGGGGMPYPTGLPMPGGAGGRAGLALASLLPGMGTIKAGLAGMGVALTGSALSNMAGSLSQYSPELANAKANSDLRNMQAQMDRAQTLGPSLAKFERRWNEMMNQFYEMGTRILDALLKLIEGMGPVWDWFIQSSSRVAAVLELAIKGWEMIVNIFNPKKLEELAVQRDEIIRRIIEGFQKKDEKFDGDFWLKQLDQITIPQFKAGAA